MSKRSVNFLLAATNMLIAGSTMAIVAPAVSTQGDKIETLNAASVKAVEGSWLQVPNACKARGFNADAKPLAFRGPQAHVRELYTLFGQ